MQDNPLRDLSQAFDSVGYPIRENPMNSMKLLRLVVLVRILNYLHVETEKIGCRGVINYINHSYTYFWYHEYTLEYICEASPPRIDREMYRADYLGTFPIIKTVSLETYAM